MKVEAKRGGAIRSDLVGFAPLKSVKSKALQKELCKALRGGDPHCMRRTLVCLPDGIQYIQQDLLSHSSFPTHHTNQPSSLLLKMGSVEVWIYL